MLSALRLVRDQPRFLDALAVAKSAVGVKHTATTFGLLLDAAEKRFAEHAGREQQYVKSSRHH